MPRQGPLPSASTLLDACLPHENAARRASCRRERVPTFTFVGFRSSPAVPAGQSALPLGPEHEEELLPLVLSRTLFRAHPLKFFTDFGRVLVLPLQSNKSRLLLGKLAFTLNYLTLDMSQLVIDSFGVRATRVHLHCLQLRDD